MMHTFHCLDLGWFVCVNFSAPASVCVYPSVSVLVCSMSVSLWLATQLLYLRDICISLLTCIGLHSTSSHAGVAFSYFHLHWRRALLSPPFNISGHAVELRNWTKCRLCCCNCYGKEHWNINLYRPWLDSDKRSTVRLISPQPFNLLGSIDVGRLKEKQLSHIRSSTSGLCWRSVGLWMWRLRSYHWSI